MKIDRRAALRDTARIVAWGIGLFALVQGIAMFMAQNHTGSVIAQLAAAEIGTSRLGVAWSDALAPLQTTAQIAMRALRGAAYALAACVILVGASILFRVTAMGTLSLSLSPMLLGAIVCAFTAARDELLLRGLVLRALGPTASFAARLVTCGLAAASFRFGTGPAPWTAIAFAGLAGVALGALWLRDRGAWLAWGANAAFSLTLTTVAPAADLDASIVAVVCGAFFAASAALLAHRFTRDEATQRVLN